MDSEESESSDSDCIRGLSQRGGNEAAIRFVHTGNLLFKTENINSEEFSFKVKSAKCSFKCNKKCAEVVNSLSDEELDSYKVKFKGQTVVNSKNNLLKHLKSQSDLGVSLRGYVLKGHTFCIKFFSNFTNISEYILKTVLRDFLNGAQRYIHGNDSNPRESVAAVKFTSWMKTFRKAFTKVKSQT